MRLRERTGEPDPQAERELEAIDDALAGRPVDADLAGWAELAEMLRGERPEPDDGWSAELDERVSERFPRRPGSGRRDVADLGARLAELMPRRMTPAVAGLATLVVVAVVAATTLSTGDDSGDSGQLQSLDRGELSEQMETTTAAPDAAVAPESAGAGAAGDAAAPAPADLGYADQEAEGAIRAGGREDGAISPGVENRKVDRDVTLALAAPPEDVNDVSDKAIAITRDLDGIVATSNVSTAGRDASATLELVIPTRNLDTAIDRLTEIGDVRSLEEASTDITRPYVTAEDRLEDAEAERKELLEALGNASTDAEAEAIRIQISDARKEIAKAQAAFDNIARKAQLSEVSLTIKGDRDASATSDDDDKSLGDWFDDAKDVLSDVAGILLVAAAILIPAAILLMIAWLLIRRSIRRRRERALD